MRVTIQIKENVARELHDHFSHPTDSPNLTSQTGRLLRALADLDTPLTPLHPGATHPLLVPFFLARARDRASAAQLIRRLRRFKSVEAAYVSPELGLPNQQEEARLT